MNLTPGEYETIIFQRDARIAALEQQLAAVTRERNELQRRVDAAMAVEFHYDGEETCNDGADAVLRDIRAALAPKETT